MNYIVTKALTLIIPTTYKIEEGITYVRKSQKVELKPSGIFCAKCRGSKNVEDYRNRTVIDWKLLKSWTINVGWDKTVTGIEEDITFIPEWLQAFPWEVTHIVDVEWLPVTDEDWKLLVLNHQE